MTRLTWQENGEEFFLSGGSTPGSPLLTYTQTKNCAYGATAINPDIMDVYVE